MPTKKKPTPTPSQSAEQPSLTTKEIIRAATNDPALAENEFTFGGRTFKVIDLRYQDYLRFLAHVEPIIKLIASNATGQSIQSLTDLTLGSAGFSIDGIIRYCAKDLPDMVAIICQQTDKTVTAEWVEGNARSPFVLAGIVMKQIAQNNMIGDIGSFFVSMKPMMAAFGLNPATKTKETRS